jgi:hypothetical protein
MKLVILFEVQSDKNKTGLNYKSNAYLFIMKDRFYEEVELIFHKFPKYHMKILLGDFNAKVGREDIFKPTTGKDRIHENNNDNGVKVVNLAASKNLTVKS